MGPDISTSEGRIMARAYLGTGLLLVVGVFLSVFEGEIPFGALLIALGIGFYLFCVYLVKRITRPERVPWTCWHCHATFLDNPPVCPRCGTIRY